VLPLALAGLRWLLDRWQASRGQTFTSGLEMHFGWLVALSYLGCLTHPLLDWQTSYAIQLFTPFDRRWYHNDSLFIVDVWIWLGLGFAIWLSKQRERRGWDNWRAPAITAATVVLAYISANGALSRFAFAAPAKGPPHARADSIVVSPPPVLFWRRSVIWRQGHDLWSGDYDPFVSLTTLKDYTGPTADGMGDPIARKALLGDPRLARFRRWSILPMAAVERHRCYVRISYQDARFGMRPGRARLGESVAVATEAPGC
jgi:inner membrane protein